MQLELAYMIVGERFVSLVEVTSNWNATGQPRVQVGSPVPSSGRIILLERPA